MVWHASEIPSEIRSAVRYRLYGLDGPLSWREVIAGWLESNNFVDFYSALLADLPCEAFRWETPPLLASGIDALFEFAVIRSASLGRVADPTAFETHFDSTKSIATFKNLGRDSTLVAPCPTGGVDDFAHLAAFLRSASPSSVRALWAAVGGALVDRLGTKPVWLSTAGAGVPWLHVRLDDRPKYYSYTPYKPAVS